MNSATSTLRAQTVSRQLAQAGFKKSEWHPSGQVKGWGDTTEGFEVEQEMERTQDFRTKFTKSGQRYREQIKKATGRVFVRTHQQDSTLEAMKQALEAKGHSVELTKDWRDKACLIVTQS